MEDFVMAPESICERRTEIEKRLRENHSQRIVIEAELIGLQHECEHDGNATRCWECGKPVNVVMRGGEGK